MEPAGGGEEKMVHFFRGSSQSSLCGLSSLCAIIIVAASIIQQEIIYF